MAPSGFNYAKKNSVSVSSAHSKFFFPGLRACFSIIKKQARGRLRKGWTDWQTDGLTDWPTDGRRFQYLSEYVLRYKKGTLKNSWEIFSKNPPNSFWKQMQQKRSDWIFDIISWTGGKFCTKWPFMLLHKLKLRIF